MRRLIWIATGLVLFGCIAAQAQIMVFDPAITIRNTTTAIVKELLRTCRSSSGGRFDGCPGGSACLPTCRSTAAGAAALAHPHLQRPGGRAVRRRLPRRAELRRRQRQCFSRRDSARDRCSRAVRRRGSHQPFASSRHAWRRSTSPTRRPSRRRTIQDTSATTAAASRPRSTNSTPTCSIRRTSRARRP